MIPMETNVVQRALELGYSKQEIGCGRPLGSYIKSKFKPLPQKIHYNGFMVWAYKPSERLDKAIHEFFNLVRETRDLID